MSNNTPPTIYIYIYIYIVTCTVYTCTVYTRKIETLIFKNEINQLTLGQRLIDKEYIHSLFTF